MLPPLCSINPIQYLQVLTMNSGTTEKNPLFDEFEVDGTTYEPEGNV